MKRNSILPRLDRLVLLGFLGIVLGALLSVWVVSQDFLPGARLFPEFLAGIGGVITVIAIVRVWLGQEPAMGPGQVIPAGDEDAFATYRQALVTFGSIAVYYVAVLLLGFMVATAIYLFVFARAYRQSYTYAVITTCAAVAFVYGINAALDLHLPEAWLVSLVS